MWKYWTPKTLTRVNDLGLAASTPCRLAGSPTMSPSVLRLPALGLSRGAFLEQTICGLLTVYSSEISGFLIPLTWLQANQYFLCLPLMFSLSMPSIHVPRWDEPPIVFCLNFDFSKLNMFVLKGNWNSFKGVELQIPPPSSIANCLPVKYVFPILFVLLLHMNILLVILIWHLVTALDRPRLNKGRAFQWQVLIVETTAPLLNDV